MTGSAFSVLNAADPVQREQWLQHWRSWPQREVFAHPSYVELFADGRDQVLAAVYESSEYGNVLYPYILRTIPNSPEGSAYTDITTPYGYGGPFAWESPSREQLAEKFWSAFDAWAEEQQVISQFARMSLFGEALLPYRGELIERQPNIVVDLDRDYGEIWRGFAPKVRKNVKRAKRDGVVIEVDDGPGRFDVFLEIYESTMRRRGAEDSYFFSRVFFEKLHSGLDAQFVYFFAFREGEPVSTELVLVSEESVYSFLGGTKEEAFPSRPNDLLKTEVMQWASANGKKYFVLGGGYEAGDGIERYKRAYSPTGGVSFTTGQRVQNQRVYNELSSHLNVSDGLPESGFFPLYRSARSKGA